MASQPTLLSSANPERAATRTFIPNNKRKADHDDIVIDTAREQMVLFYHKENERLCARNQKLKQEKLEQFFAAKKARRALRAAESTIDRMVDQEESIRHECNYLFASNEAITKWARDLMNDHPELDDRGMELLSTLARVNREYYPGPVSQPPTETDGYDSDITESDDEQQALIFDME